VADNPHAGFVAIKDLIVDERALELAGAALGAFVNVDL
jgi:hypothetical protein